MPDGDKTPDAVLAALFAPLTRLGERVAALEANHAALKGDTETIRASSHAINNELQKIVVAEEACRQSLLHITAQVNTLPGLAAMVEEFRGMRQDLRDVIADRQHRVGERAALRAVNAVLPWLVAIAGVVAWGWEHFAR